MKETYMVYAHQYKWPEDGWGLILTPIGVARNQEEVDTIIKNFRKDKQQRGKYEYWMDYHTDDDHNIKCSTKIIENKYLE